MAELNEEMFKNGYNPRSFTINDHMKKGEKVLWHQKPKAKSYVASQVAGLTPFAIIWLLIDSIFIVSFFAFGNGGIPLYVYIILIGFFAIHLMPVWLWIGSIVRAFKAVKYIEYYITNLRVLKADTTYAMEIAEEINIADITDVELKKTWFDKLSMVGDVDIVAGETTIKLYDIREPEKIHAIFYNIKSKYKNLASIPVYRFCEYCGRELVDKEFKCASCGALYTTRDVE